MKPYRSAITGYRKSYRAYKLIICTMLLTVILIPMTARSPHLFHKPHTLSQLVNAVSTKQGLSPKLVASIVQVESSGRPSAVSSKAAVGLMQVHLPTWSHKWSRKQLLDPERNLMAGTTILKQYIKESRSLDEALHKYSGGAKDYAKKIRRGMRG
jgi:soluble lytic murein transglycosylase-like protein